MTDNYSWQQLHELITEMKHENKVTRTIPRINYSTLLSILTNQTVFQYTKNTTLIITVQDDNITITMEMKQ